MAGGLYAIATELAVLASGRLPEWTDAFRSEVLTAIPSGSAGLALQSRVLTHVAVDLRANISGRTARIAVGALDLTATYTVTIDGVACAYDAGGGGAATLADVLAGIAAAITTSASALVVATVDSTEEEVQIRSLASTGVAVTAFTATGTGALTCEAEPASADVEIYCQTVAPVTGWRLLAASAGGGVVTVDHKGLATMVPTAGLTRLAVRLTNLTGHPTDAAGVSLVPYRAAIGPAKLEPAA